MFKYFFGSLLTISVCIAQITTDSTYQRTGIIDRLPVFTAPQLSRLTFSYSWLSGNFTNFNEWKKVTREKFRECLLTPPPHCAFNPLVLAEQDRGSYVARKIVFSISADSRILGYMVIPKGKGPFPAVLLLHDHGAKFDIGKEKMIEPFYVDPACLDSARIWVKKLYGGRFIGDELAKRGYICFTTDALNWSDRGGGGAENQQAIASNLFNLGMSFAGVVAWDDLRTVEFLVSQALVDTQHIAAIGLSFGAFRTWQLAALSDKITCGIAVCEIATLKGLMSPGNNQTKGQSAFTMTHPGLSNYLDWPDVASLACPKPMLFYNGEHDKLFPVPTVKEAYTKMKKVWESQHASDKLVTKFWDAGHEFNLEMQNAAFKWLDSNMK